MKLEVFPSAEAAAHAAAVLLATAIEEAVGARGQCVMAVSGGRSPWLMLRALADMALPWDNLHIAQVDERIAPAGDADRNYTHLRENLLQGAALRPDHVHPMPVEAADLSAAANAYAQTLAKIAGSPPILDVIHLGLGPDGHTASLVPGDPVLDVASADVALTGIYQGRRRMTLTYPTLNRARRILWLVTGADKVSAFARLRKADPSIPAGRVQQAQASVIADSAAAETP